MVSSLDLFSLLFLFLQLQQPHQHISPPLGFIYFLKLFISNIHPETKFMTLKSGNHQFLAIIFGNNSYCAIWSYPGRNCHMILLENQLIMPKNNKWPLHLNSYTKMLAESYFSVCFFLKYLVDSITIFILVTTVFGYKPLFLKFFIL